MSESRAVLPEDLVSVQHAADALGKNYATIYRWLDAGKIKGVVVDGVQFIHKSEVARLLASNGQGSEAAEG